MIKIKNVETVGWEAAIRGMRNPMNSWEKSDSGPAVDCGRCGKIERDGICTAEDRDCTGFECFYVGPNDYDLMTRLRNAGTDHRKFMRMIVVYLDITAPLYWWKEFDTYKIGTVANSCSTMHKIHEKEFTLKDFSYENLGDEEFGVNGLRNTTSMHKIHEKELTLEDFSYENLGNEEFGVNGLRNTTSMDILGIVIDALNYYRRCYNEDGKSKYDWYNLIQLLPSSYNQKRTVMLNYEVLANMYESRRNHKLDEWRDFCEWIESLPYSELITGQSLGDLPICNEIMEEAKKRVTNEGENKNGKNNCI